MKPQRQGSKKVNDFLKLICIAALVSGAAILFTACENNIEQIKAFVSTENLPLVQAENFETVFTDSGQVRFFLKAPRLERYEAEGKPYVEFPDGLELIKYDASKNIISRIKARYARQYLQEKKWEAKNDVVAVNAAGDTLKTELLIWDENSERIYSDKFVRIIRPDQIINGIGFESDQALQNWRIKNITGTIYVTMQTSGDQSSGQSNADTAISKKNNPVIIKE